MLLSYPLWVWAPRLRVSSLLSLLLVLFDVVCATPVSGSLLLLLPPLPLFTFQFVCTAFLLFVLLLVFPLLLPAL